MELNSINQTPPSVGLSTLSAISAAKISLSQMPSPTLLQAPTNPLSLQLLNDIVLDNTQKIQAVLNAFAQRLGLAQNTRLNTLLSSQTKLLVKPLALNSPSGIMSMDQLFSRSLKRAILNSLNLEENTKIRLSPFDHLQHKITQALSEGISRAAASIETAVSGISQNLAQQTNNTPVIPLSTQNGPAQTLSSQRKEQKPYTQKPRPIPYEERKAPQKDKSNRPSVFNRIQQWLRKKLDSILGASDKNLPGLGAISRADHTLSLHGL